MAAESGRRVGVIGAGIVGLCAALWLQRDGHRVFLVEPGTPGEGASFGNAGCFNGSSVTPAGMPGVIKQVPRWLMDPLGPLALRWSYLPQILPYLVRFVRSATPEKVRAQARAMRPLVGPTVPLVRELAKMADADTLVHQRGHLYVYRSAEALAKDGFAWALRRDRAGAGIRLPARRQAVDGDQHRSRRPAGRSGGRLRRGLFEAARRVARRPGAARNRARLSPDDPRPGDHAAHPDRRCRRQICRDADGYGAALCRHGRIGRARRAA